MNTFQRGVALSIEDNKKNNADTISNTTAQEKPSSNDAEPTITNVPVKEEPKVEVQPVVEEKKTDSAPATSTDAAPTAPSAAKPRSASKKEQKESKCFCM